MVQSGGKDQGAALQRRTEELKKKVEGIKGRIEDKEKERVALELEIEAIEKENLDLQGKLQNEQNSINGQVPIKQEKERQRANKEAHKL